MFSVIIPNFNQKEYVRYAIRSVLSQSHQDYEIIVVDDGSTDGSKAVIDEFGSCVKYIWQENQGLAGARNTGIRAAQGDFIALLDADDLWLPDYLESMDLLIKQYPGAAVYYCRAQCIDAAGDLLPQRVGVPTILLDTKEKTYKNFVWSNYLIPSTVTLRRSLVEKAGYFDQSLRSCEDWDLWLRILPESDFVWADKVLVQYRIHEYSLSADVTGMHNAKQAVVEKHFGLDDGQYETWSSDKKLAYAGLYRYFLLTSIQRRGEWHMGSAYLRKCLAIDASRTLDVDLFYELSLGAQPVGYRGSTEKLAIEDNAANIMNLLDTVFRADDTGLETYKRRAYGIACYAIGLCAYNTRHLALSRSYFQLAAKYRPSLLISFPLLLNWFKSLLGEPLLTKIRSLKRS